jgi:phosphoenolpyruvate carboxykinase (ATP)
LSPRKTWNNDKGFYETAFKLSKSFIDNFKKYEDYASKEIMSGAPNLR